MEEVLHDGEYGGGGKISALAETVPGRCQSVGRKAQGALHGFENLRSATVEDVAADVAHAEIVVGEEVFNGAPQLRVDEFRNVRGQDDVEPALIDVPPHQVFGVGIERGASGDDARAGLVDASGLSGDRRLFPGEDDGGRAISE